VHKKPEDLNAGKWDMIPDWQAETWGDLEVCYTDLPGPLDASASYELMPTGDCPCPHYMYLLSGRMRARYTDPDVEDEVVEAGEVCFIPAGHVLIYEEATKAIEFNPAGPLKFLMDGINDLIKQQIATGQPQLGEA
jgi:hypothetical protein